MVGASLLPLLAATGHRVVACSRHDHLSASNGSGHIEYRKLSQLAGNPLGEEITDWICLAPIWALPEHFPTLERCRARRIVALGSTSIFAKRHSSDTAEREVAGKLAEGERQLAAWAEANNIRWVILRPTLIYGMGRDRNICEMARFIARFGFFPVFGKALGMRQPVHVEDVAKACLAALLSKHACNRAYNLSGAEVLPYRDMIGQIFRTLGKAERLVGIPLPLFRAAVACLHILPRFRQWSPAMAERMNVDLVFEHTEAARDFGFAPRPFRLDQKDLPFA